MKSTIFIHAGIHKTGTTSIQHFIDNNKNILNEKYLDYIEIGKHGPGHHLIPWAFKNSNRLNGIQDSEQVINSFVKYINENLDRNFLISSEEFEFLNEKQILNLKKIISSLNCKIIFYIKRQDHLLISEYKQIVKQYRTRFSGSVLDFIFSYKFWGRLNYLSLLEKWSKHFGIDALDVHIFDPQELHNNNVVDDFMKTLGVDKVDNAVPANIFHNKSPSDLACEVIRAYNDFKLNQKTHEKIVELSQKLSSTADKDEDYTLISERERQSICAAYEFTNNIILEKYFKKKDYKKTGLFQNDFEIVKDHINKSELVSEIKEQINKKLNLQA